MRNTNDSITPELNEEAEHILLTDEEGNEYPFDLMDVIPYSGDEYAVFFPADETDEDEDEDTEVVILKVIPHDDGSAEFEEPEDDKVIDAVFSIFMENMRKAFEEDGCHSDGCGCDECSN